jgi:hypothetical protein
LRCDDCCHSREIAKDCIVSTDKVVGEFKVGTAEDLDWTKSSKVVVYEASIGDFKSRPYAQDAVSFCYIPVLSAEVVVSKDSVTEDGWIERSHDCHNPKDWKAALRCGSLPTVYELAVVKG